MYKLILILVFISGTALGQDTEYNLDLKVVESSTQVGSDVAYATVYIKETQTEFVTDKNGLINLQLQPGTYNLYITSLGMEEKVIVINVKGDSFNLVQLQPAGERLEQFMGTTTSASIH